MAPPVPNKTLIFKAIPDSIIIPNQHMLLEDRPLDITSPPPKGMIVKTLINGFDPHMRDRMRGPSFQSYVPGYHFDAPISAFSAGVVLCSDTPRFDKGDLVYGVLDVAEYSAVPDYMIEAKPEAMYLINKIENKEGIDVAHWVGVLGLAGQTAWTSFYGLVKPHVKAGDTIWVNAASGTVGELVVQLAKREGLRVIASVGSEDKKAYVKEELGADDVFNYKDDPPTEALPRLAPQGLDVVYENVGCEHFQAAVDNVKRWGRIVVCGMIAEYNKNPAEPLRGVTSLANIFRKRITVRGFIFSDKDIYPQTIGEFWSTVPGLIKEGKIKARTTQFEGIESAQEAFLSLFEGHSFGKAKLRVAEL